MVIRSETLLINTYIFGGWKWRWWQDIDKPNNNINSMTLWRLVTTMTQWRRFYVLH